MRSCIASLLFGKVLSILLANWYIKVCSLNYLSLPSQAEVNTALPLPSIPSPMCHSEPGASWSHTETPQIREKAGGSPVGCVLPDPARAVCGLAFTCRSSLHPQECGLPKASGVWARE